MWRREDAVVVLLLQGLPVPLNVPHSRFAAVRGFPVGPRERGALDWAILCGAWGVGKR